jgi:lipoprotein-releasing system permease protein
MFFSLPFYIGFRYTRAKRRNHFISFVALASMIGIALGVAVLITVLSVMNGFDYEIHTHIFNMSEHVIINSQTGALTDWQELDSKVLSTKHVIGAAPFVSAQGMLTNSGVASGVMIRGILPNKEIAVSDIDEKMLEGKLAELTPNSFGIILGTTLADSLNVIVGDKVTLVTPQATVTPIGVMPRFKRFTVLGIFSTGEPTYDTNIAFVNLNDAQKLLQLGNAVSGLRLKVDDLYIAPQVAGNLYASLDGHYIVSDWTQQYGTYFKAIRMEKTMMFIILLFIIAIAAFNLVSSLVMTVTDKQADIAILRTLGASPRTIMQIFIVQGAIIGVIGTLIGVIGGIILALNAPTLVAMLEHIFHTKFISAQVYIIDYLPSKLDWWNVLYVSIAALAMSLVATIYPAWRAAKTNPAEALRYE